MDCHATARGSILGRNGVFIELHVLRKGVPSLNDLAVDGTLTTTNQPTNFIFPFWLINPLECFFGSENVALDRNPGLGYNILILQFTQGDLVHVPIDNSKHYPAFQTVRLHCQTPTLTHAFNAGMQFVAFLWWSLVLPDRDANPRPTAREADTLTTKPTQQVPFWYILSIYLLFWL